MTAETPMVGEQDVWNPWPHRLALATTVTTFLLILAGGIVTNTGTGMAVPDWPTTFGHNMFLYPWSQMVGGILYEHAHRLIGSLVGALTLTLAIFLWALEPRKWVRGLGIAALGAVVVQGVLGGLRVRRRTDWQSCMGDSLMRSSLSSRA
jgi:cytochrome c oxidase assembly protein subunit 15